MSKLLACTRRQSPNSIFTSAPWYNGATFYAHGVYHVLEERLHRKTTSRRYPNTASTLFARSGNCSGPTPTMLRSPEETQRGGRSVCTSLEHYTGCSLIATYCRERRAGTTETNFSHSLLLLRKFHNGAFECLSEIVLKFPLEINLPLAAALCGTEMEVSWSFSLNNLSLNRRKIQQGETALYVGFHDFRSRFSLVTGRQDKYGAHHSNFHFVRNVSK